MKFNTKNKDLRNYHFLDFIEDNYNELFEAYKSGFYNPDTNEITEEAFNKWFEQNEEIEIDEHYSIILENPIEMEKRFRYIETRDFPVWVTYPDGTHELQNFKHTLVNPSNGRINKYCISANAWDQFSLTWPENYKESDSEKIDEDLLKDVKRIVKRYGDLQFCIKGDWGVIAYYKSANPIDNLYIAKQNKKLLEKYNTEIYLQNI